MDPFESASGPDLSLTTASMLRTRLKQQTSKRGSLLLDVEAETSSMRRASAALTRHAEDNRARLAAAAAACNRVSAAVAAREAALAAAVEQFDMLQTLYDSGESGV